MASLQSWAGAGLLGMIRALIRDDDPPFLGRPRHGDLPDEWDESLVHEIALALAVSAPSAGKTTRAAWELGARRQPRQGALVRPNHPPRAHLHPGPEAVSGVIAAAWPGGRARSGGAAVCSTKPAPRPVTRPRMTVLGTRVGLSAGGVSRRMT